MSVILIANWRAARSAQLLADAISPDPAVRDRARVRYLAEVVRREKRLQGLRQPAEVVVLDTRRQGGQRPAWARPKDY